MSCWYLLLCDEYRLKRCQWSLPTLYDLSSGCELGTVNLLSVVWDLTQIAMLNLVLRALAGSYCGSNTTTLLALSSGGGTWSNAADLSGACFNGTYCPEGMIRAPDLDRDACSAGIIVPRGKYSFALLKTNSAIAKLFLLNFIQFLALAFTGMCEPGHYCPAQSTGPKQVPCPARSYRPEYGGASLDDCSLCCWGLLPFRDF